MQVLLVQRPIEAVLVEDVFFRRRRQGLVGFVERSAGHGVHEHKGQDRHDQEDDDDARQAAEQIDNHGYVRRPELFEVLERTG